MAILVGFNLNSYQRLIINQNHHLHQASHPLIPQYPYMVDCATSIIYPNQDYCLKTEDICYIIKLRMFSSEINLRVGSKGGGWGGGWREAEYSAVDLQYQICSKFLKVGCEKLYQKELELIDSSSKFIEKIVESMAQKDISSTQESTNFDTFVDDQDTFAQSKSRLLLRKSRSNANLRRTQSGLTEALREVSSKCSEKTSSLVLSMSSEFRKMKQKLAGLQKMQKETKKTEAKLYAAQQELVVMRKRVSDLEGSTKMLQEQAVLLKKKVKDFNEECKTTKLSLSKSSDNLKSLANPTAPQKLKKYIQEKQLYVFKKEKQIKVIQNNIQCQLQGCISEGCEKCCQLMKKIKESIIKYRTYLEEQANVSEVLFNKCKSILC